MVGVVLVVAVFLLLSGPGDDQPGGSATGQGDEEGTIEQQRAPRQGEDATDEDGAGTNDEPDGDGSPQDDPEPAPPPPSWNEIQREYEQYTGPRDLEVSSLEVHDGRLNIREAGAVIDGMRIDGSVHVLASDVTIRNSVINGVLHFREGSDGSRLMDSVVRSGAPYPVRNDYGARDILLDHCEIDGLESASNNGGVTGGRITVRYCELHSHTDSAKVGSDSVWEYNWLHGNGQWGTDAHSDGLQSTSGTNITVRRNLIDMPAEAGGNSAMHFKATFGSLRDIVIEENYLNGGNFTVYVRADSEGEPQNVRISDNRFGRDHRYGTLSIEGDVAEQGNIWHDDEHPVER